MRFYVVEPICRCKRVEAKCWAARISGRHDNAIWRVHARRLDQAKYVGAGVTVGIREIDRLEILIKRLSEEGLVEIKRIISDEYRGGPRSQFICDCTYRLVVGRQRRIGQNCRPRPGLLSVPQVQAQHAA